jgi:GMP synthase-like glutamine amidotransferase
MKAAVLQHVAFETPRAYGPALTEAGYHPRTWLVPQDGLPPGDEDALLILGGPMSVNDPDAWIAEEIQYIARAIDRGIPVVGVCLGSQLIARAVGGEVYPTDHPEIGLCAVTLTEAGLADPCLAGFPASLPLIQWHGQGIRVPDSCTVLASSDAFPVQAFRAAPRVYGLLFHLELDRAGLETLCRECPDDIAASGKSADALLADALPHLPALQQLARSFLGRVLEGTHSREAG